MSTTICSSTIISVEKCSFAFVPFFCKTSYIEVLQKKYKKLMNFCCIFIKFYYLLIKRENILNQG